MATKDISDLQVLTAYKQMWENDLKESADEILNRATGQPLKVCLSAMERAYGRGLIECGVSLCRGWLTPKGFEHIGEGAGKK